MFAVRRNLAAAVKCWRHLHYPRWVYVVASTLVKCLMNVLPSMKFPIQTESLQSDRGARERERKTFSKDAAISNRPHNQTPFPQIVRTKKSKTNKRKKNKCRTKPNWNAATQQTNSIQCVPCPLVFCSKCFIRACAQKFKKSEKKKSKRNQRKKKRCCKHTRRHKRRRPKRSCGCPNECAQCTACTARQEHYAFVAYI